MVTNMAFSAKRASAHRKEDCKDISEDGINAPSKRGKFKSPVSRDVYPFKENRSPEQVVAKHCGAYQKLVSGSQVKRDSDAKDCEDGPSIVRRRPFGNRSTNLRLPLQDGRTFCDINNDRIDSCRSLGDSESFGPAIHEEDKDFGKSAEKETNFALDSACKSSRANRSGLLIEPPAASIVERESMSEDDHFNRSVGTRDVQIGIGLSGSSRASARGSIYSQFKMPTRVVPGCKTPEVSEIARISSCAPARQEGFQSSHPSSTTSLISGISNDSRWKAENIQPEYYSVMYCIWKPNSKRKGPWFDGILVRRKRSCILQDTEGKDVSRDCEQRGGPLSEGSTLIMGKYEVEVMGGSTEEECFRGTVLSGTAAVAADVTANLIQKPTLKSFKNPLAKQIRTPSDLGMITSIKVPTAEVNSCQGRTDLLLNASDLKGATVPVIVDSYVASRLRPHQREGVQFMYECIMGLRNPSFTGCLLADAMGLGKTLQVIALIWTLIKQGPKGNPALEKALVICPSSLVENWGREVRKWLGNERLTPLIIHSGISSKDVKRKIFNFQVGRVYRLLITSYELLRKHKDDLKSARPGLLVCDEAHRLKNCAGNKTISSLLELNCPRKIILTGTPVQNDLLEFFAMIEFVNPTLLGQLLDFKRHFANSIERSRDRDASETEKLLGRARSVELQSLTRFCILRRTANVNSKYLPAKTEFVVFCRLQPLQVSLYRKFLNSKLLTESLSSDQSAFVLSAIGTLRKLCNHPRLVENELNYGNGDRASSGQREHFDRRTPVDWTQAGKLSCLQKILAVVHNSARPPTRDKVVVVSNFTQTLNIIQTLCEGQGWRSLRLDGATAVSERQALVDRFNTNQEESVFLLSSKAGGSGLNLVGANRLILFDPDWNPATDSQAMARIWRDGQTKEVIIYRLLSTSSIEEKIFQRQIMKGEVAAAVEDQVDVQLSEGDGGGNRHFSREEIRELFTLNMETSCDTFDLVSPSKSSDWRDYSDEVEDDPLRQAILAALVTFVYKKDTIPSFNNGQCEGVVSGLEEPILGLDESQSIVSGALSSDVHVEGIDDLLANYDQRPADENDKGGTIFEQKLPLPQLVADASPLDISAVDVEEHCKQTSPRSCFGVADDGRREIWDPSTHSVIANSLEPSLSLSRRASYNAVKVVESGSLQRRYLNTSELSKEHDDTDCNDYHREVVVVSQAREEQNADAGRRGCRTTPILDQEHRRTNIEIVSDNKRDAEAHGLDLNVNAPNLSPAPIFVTEEAFPCLLEGRCQRILKVLMDLPSPGDDSDENELDILDAPFLCSLELEMVMQRASFAPEDLWQGIKTFAVGFILGIKEEKLSYKGSKLGQILETCNLDRCADDESIFCKGLPLVRSVLNRRSGQRATDVANLFRQFEDEDRLPTSNGKFIKELVSVVDAARKPQGLTNQSQ